jgi:hypothetical protein
MKSYRLPNGKYTTSVNVYLRKWTTLRRIVERKLGVQVHSFNPDFSVSPKGNMNLSAHIPLWLALSFQAENDRVTKNQKNR